MLTQNEMQQVIDYTASKGAEFSELFLEDRADQEIRYADGSVQAVKNVHIYGAGLRLINGTEAIYTYTNDVSIKGLKSLADEALSLLSSKAANMTGAKALSVAHRIVDPNPVRREPSEMAIKEKIEIARRASSAVEGAGVPLLAHNVVYSDMDQRIWVANSEGVLASDRRVNTRARAYYTVGDETGSSYEWADVVKCGGMEGWNSDELEQYLREKLRSTYTSMKGDVLKSCKLPVVMAAGGCGTLWHESCGHSLEAVAIADGNGDFIGLIGERVASPKVTLIDDGTMPGLYGSSMIDDEGHQRQRNVMIENGVLKTYLCDYLQGKKIGMQSNGCGRRQDYTFAPTSRMSNTYLAPGNDDEEEMIRSLAEGLYVKRLGGGSGGSIFSLLCTEAYLIKNGQIDRPVKNCMITGRGIDVIKKIDRVGSVLKAEYGGFCGAGSGLVPTTSFQPQVRISEMTVGGAG